MPHRLVIVGAVLAATLLPAPAGAGAAATGFVRVDQVGYGTGDPKPAYLMTSVPVPGAAFTVLDASGRVVLRGRAGPDRGRWNAAYPAVYPLDVTRLHSPGSYRIRVSGTVDATSPPFRVAPRATLLRPLIDDAVSFFTAQRDGADVIPGALHRRPSHRNDARAAIYAWPHFVGPGTDLIADATLHRIGGTIDVEGGWFDAGDFLKFSHTTAYADALLFSAERDLGRAAPAALDREARFGLAWLRKAWDPARDAMVVQVGIGSGNRAGTFVGDHDLWRLPQRDDRLPGAATRYLRHRPVFITDAAPGRLAPNLAGRTAAAFALAAQLDAGSRPQQARSELATAAEIFGRAKTRDVRPADVVTALPHAFYPESAWRDDMALGAAELARAGRLLDDPRSRGWLAAAEHFAADYAARETGDTLNLYDVSALADSEVAALEPTRPGSGVSRDLRRQLDGARAAAAEDPFRAGADYDDFDVASHTFGLVASAEFDRALHGPGTDRSFEAAQLAWVFGANAWGVSMMIGAGSTFPQWPQHVVANLSGSLDGTPPLLRGAVVNGPNSAALFRGGLGGFFATARRCPPGGGDPYAAFTGHGSRFVDDVRAWQTVEPALDFTATAVLGLALASR